MKRLASALVPFLSLATFIVTGCDGDLGQADSPVPMDIAAIKEAAFGSGGTDVGHYYQLKSVSNGFCIDVSGKSTSDGALAIQFGCSSGENQRFYFRALSSTTYQLQAKHSAKCLHIAGGSTSSGAGLVQDPCARSGSGQNGEILTATQVGTTSPAQYQLVVKNGGLCLQAPNATSGSQIVQKACSTSSSFLWNLAVSSDPAPSDTNGRWSGVTTLPLVPISAALLPSTKVIVWASWKGTRFAGTGSLDQTVTATFPYNSPGSATAKTVTNTTHNMFCPGTAMLADGRVLVNGGDDSHTDATSIYNSATDSWSKGDLMNQERWYNVSVTLADGRVLTLGGNRTSGGDGNGEIYNPATNAWTSMPGIALSAVTKDLTNMNRIMEHPRMFLIPDGHVFVPGPTTNMTFYSLSGSGSATSVGKRGNDEVSQNDVTVMYEVDGTVARFLKAGGNITYDRNDDTTGVSASFIPSSRNSFLIDVSTGSNPVVTSIAPMKYPRTFANGVVLPNGQVVVIGGADHGKGFSDDGNIRVPELFDPPSRTWRELAPMAKPRPYHSWALLLPDGRVMEGGGGLCSSSDNCAVNHPDVEILSPPNLFGATRPTISTAPTTVDASGGTFTVSTSGTVSGFSLVRMASVTHSVDTDQRLFRPAIVSSSGGTFTLRAPPNNNVAPPGFYMLFALNGGVPSIAAIVKIT
jgi:galactose oxidase